MDLDHLSKSQIILLTLLVSFVTSIATGIVTVSLMEQAPPIVAQTVNRVIERTVESVAPSKAAGQAAATVVTQEKTVVVRSDELLSKAVDRASASVVRVYAARGENPEFLGLGVVLESGGIIAVDGSALAAESDAQVVRSDGSRVRAFVTRREEGVGLAYLQAATTSDDKPLAWTPAMLSKSQPVLGQSVAALAGKSAARIAPAVITALIAGGEAQIIDTNAPPDAIAPGSPLINLDGEVIGVSTSVSRASSNQGFVPAQALSSSASKK